MTYSNASFFERHWLAACCTTGILCAVASSLGTTWYHNAQEPSVDIITVATSNHTEQSAQSSPAINTLSPFAIVAPARTASKDAPEAENQESEPEASRIYDYASSENVSPSFEETREERSARWKAEREAKWIEQYGNFEIPPYFEINDEEYYCTPETYKKEFTCDSTVHADSTVKFELTTQGNNAYALLQNTRKTHADGTEAIIIYSTSRQKNMIEAGQYDPDNLQQYTYRKDIVNRETGVRNTFIFNASGELNSLRRRTPEESIDVDLSSPGAEQIKEIKTVHNKNKIITYCNVDGLITNVVKPNEFGYEDNENIHPEKIGQPCPSLQDLGLSLP